MRLAMYGNERIGWPLPYPALSHRCLLIVEQAVCAAWNRMVRQPRGAFDVFSADEDRVTHELYERLFDEVFDHGIVDGFDGEIFAGIEREAKIRNFDASHLDKMPDLLVRFVDRPSGVMNTQYGLFIECKPVDAAHTTGSCYCNKGLIRFIRGDYAWAMRNAMMIAYARTGYELLSELSAALTVKQSGTIPTVAAPAPCPRSVASDTAEQVVTTIHERTFCYVESESPPGLISIRHLWLRR